MVTPSRHHADLFGSPTTPSLDYRAEIVTPCEEELLTAAIEQVDLSPFQFQQWTAKRLTHSYGWRYDFQTGTLGRTDPIPDWLLPIRERAARFAELQPDKLVQALLIRYDPGAGIGWHKDRPAFEHVVGVSLGTPATMRFRRRDAKGFQRFAAPLAPRSIYRLSGEIRDDWEHSIAALEERRWSITFRSLR